MAQNGSHFSDFDNWGNDDSQLFTAFTDVNNTNTGYRAVDGAYVTSSGYVRKRKRRRSKKGPIIAFFAVLILALLAVAGVFGWKLLSQAREVKAQAKEVVALVEDVPEAILSGDTASLPATASQVVTLADDINNTVHNPLWNIASNFPYVGSDIKSAQTLGDTLVDLANNALAPVADNLQGLELSDLFSNRRVNVEKLTSLSNAVATAKPVIERSAATIESLPAANIGQVRDYIEKVREPLSELSGILTEAGDFVSLLPQVFGAGTSRIYLLIAQNNAELRSDGGLPGSVGFVRITNGYIEIGNFRSISHWYVENNYVGETEEEMAFFRGVDLYRDFAQVTFLPEFERVGEISAKYVEYYWPEYELAGVMAIDPTFLQQLMKITGASISVDGVTLDGSSAARVLTHEVYEMYGDSDTGSRSDEFFSEAAASAADAVFENFGNIGLEDITDLLSDTANSGHFYLWMADDAEQEAVRSLSFSGNLDYDKTEPQLGVYLNDYTQSKIDWYIGCATYVSEGYINGDGGTTYEVTTYVKNNLTSDDADQLPAYIIGGNGENKYCNSDAITRMYLFAPYGGTITDVEISYEGTIEPSVMYTDMGEGTVWGHQGHTVQFHTPAQGVTTITYKVNTAYEAEAPLTVRQTPMAQESYGSVVYAWEE